MHKVNFDLTENGKLRQVLCLGAHSDDIEIGCGGTILRLAEENPGLCFTWVVFGAGGTRGEEALNSANSFLATAWEKQIIIKEFRDGFFPYIGGEIKQFFEQLKRMVSPDLILTHYRHDMHQDHRLICELTWNTFRDHLIWEYEIPKYDGDLGAPNLFFNLDERLCEQKVSYLMEHFRTQKVKPWFTKDTFFSILRLRGVEARSPGHYAEAYYCHKVVF